MFLVFSPLAVLVGVTVAPLVVSGEEQCGGGAPMESVSTYLGATLDYAVADRICCNNHRYAERRGYLASEEVDLFSRLDPDGETIFYDSVCGIPLFVAPRGRTFDQFKEESLHHGWPSFRPEEIVSENVIIHDEGRMESKCGTHLGHNLPTGGTDRYCIDLVCIAGTPFDEQSAAAADDILPPDDGTALWGAEFDASTYTSSAEQFSGKYSKVGEKVKISLICVASVAVAMLAGLWTRRAWRRRRASSMQEEKISDSQQHKAVKGGDEDVRSHGTDSTGERGGEN